MNPEELDEFNKWQPSEAIVSPSRWGEMFIPGLTELHRAIASYSNPITLKFDPDFEEEEE